MEKQWALVQGDDGLWKYLDAQNTPFWGAVFYSKAAAIDALGEWSRFIELQDKMKNALTIISCFTKCGCRKEHGDNINCAVLIAEKTIKEYSV